MSIEACGAASPDWDSANNDRIDSKQDSPVENPTLPISETEESVEGWDRTLLSISSYLTEPACQTWKWLCFETIKPLDPSKFNNHNNKIIEIASRAFKAIAAVAISPIALLLVGVGKIFRASGFALQRNGYTYVQGKGSIVNLEEEAKIVSWNICGISGGMHYDHGGVNDWRSRIDEIEAKIRQENPDVIVLQEIYDTALAEALVERFKNDYAHFYMHLGANIWGSVGGLMVISRCAEHSFKNSSFENNDWTLNRTFACLEIKKSSKDKEPCARIIGTHLIHNQLLPKVPEQSHEDHLKASRDVSNKKRMDQIAQIVNHIAKERLALPTILAGDLNLEWTNPEEKELLNQFIIHHQNNAPTCTNSLVDQWYNKTANSQNETIDYIALFRENTKGAKLLNTHLVPAFDEKYDTKTALSDHHGIAATLKWEKTV